MLDILHSLTQLKNFFPKFKRMIRKSPTLTEDELILSIRQALNSFEPADFKGYIRHVLSFVRKSLDYMDIC